MISVSYIDSGRFHDVGVRSGDVADLLVRANDGDSEAWDEIIHRYRSVVFAVVRSFRLQDADVFDAVQMTWLRLAENLHRVSSSARLDGWLVTTARRECLHILRQQAKHAQTPVETVAENLVDPGAGPEQLVIDNVVARTLWKLVTELSPLRRTLLRALFTDNPRPYTEVARSVGIPPSGIGPTRARTLQQLRRRLEECGLGPESDSISHAEEQLPEGGRTGNYRLDDLLDEADCRLRDVLETSASIMCSPNLDEDHQEGVTHTSLQGPDIVSLVISSGSGTGDARLDELLNKADAALREVCDKDIAPH